MTPRPVPDPTAARFVVAALDHGAASLGYAAVPEPAPSPGGWRRLYLKEGGASTLAAVGADGAPWASLGIELRAPRERATARAAALVRALAPFEVALDLDAGGERLGPDAVVRVALRLFADGLNPGVVREAVGNLHHAATHARRTLGI